MRRRAKHRVPRIVDEWAAERVAEGDPRLLDLARWPLISRLRVLRLHRRESDGQDARADLQRWRRAGTCSCYIANNPSLQHAIVRKSHHVPFPAQAWSSAGRRISELTLGSDCDDAGIADDDNIPQTPDIGSIGSRGSIFELSRRRKPEQRPDDAFWTNRQGCCCCNEVRCCDSDRVERCCYCLRLGCLGSLSCFRGAKQSLAYHRKRRQSKETRLEDLRYKFMLDLLKIRKYWPTDEEELDDSIPCYACLKSCGAPHGWIEDYWFYMLNNHPFLSIIYTEDMHPFGRYRRFIIEFVVQCYCFFVAVYLETRIYPSLSPIHQKPGRFIFIRLILGLLLITGPTAAIWWSLYGMMACPCLHYRSKTRCQHWCKFWGKNSGIFFTYVGFLVPATLLLYAGLVSLVNVWDTSRYYHVWWLFNFLFFRLLGYLLWVPRTMLMQFNWKYTWSCCCCYLVGQWKMERDLDMSPTDYWRIAPPGCCLICKRCNRYPPSIQDFALGDDEPVQSISLQQRGTPTPSFDAGPALEDAESARGKSSSVSRDSAPSSTEPRSAISRHPRKPSGSIDQKVVGTRDLIPLESDFHACFGDSDDDDMIIIEDLPPIVVEEDSPTGDVRLDAKQTRELKQVRGDSDPRNPVAIQNPVAPRDSVAESSFGTSADGLRERGSSAKRARRGSVLPAFIDDILAQADRAAARARRRTKQSSGNHRQTFMHKKQRNTMGLAYYRNLFGHGRGRRSTNNSRRSANNSRGLTSNSPRPRGDSKSPKPRSIFQRMLQWTLDKPTDGQQTPSGRVRDHIEPLEDEEDGENANFESKQRKLVIQFLDGQSKLPSFRRKQADGPQSRSSLPSMQSRRAERTTQQNLRHSIQVSSMRSVGTVETTASEESTL